MYLKITTYPPRVDVVTLNNVVPAYVDFHVTSQKLPFYDKVSCTCEAIERIEEADGKANQSTYALAKEKDLPIDWEYHNGK